MVHKMGLFSVIWLIFHLHIFNRPYQYLCLMMIRCASERESQSSEATMSRVRSHRFEVFFPFNLDTNICVAGVWVLWRMPEEVWQCQCLEIFYRPVWLPSSHRPGGRPDLLSAWRVVSQHRHSGSHPGPGPTTGGPSWRPHVRPALVRPWRQRRLGDLAPWCWIHLRPGNLRTS